MSTELFKYETINTTNPITGEVVTIQIEKPDVITPEERTAKINAELEKYGINPTERVEVEDPISGNKSLITIDRTGTSEKKLIEVLADPNLSRDRKDFTISMYLYERGAQNTSMLVDLMRYKGAHSKESHVFKTQVRFDFEQFVGSFATYLEDQVSFAGEILGVDIEKERTDFYDFIKERRKLDGEDAKGKKYTYLDYYLSQRGRTTTNISERIEALTISNAIHAYEEGQTLRNTMHLLADAREREKGRGVYISAGGRPYTIDDPSLEEIIIADRAARKNAEANYE